MCSINSTGVVFLNTKPLEVSSELGIVVQTTVLGVTHDWSVRGWVVECRAERPGVAGSYQVTLLFSDLPKGLQQILAIAEGDGAHAYPVVQGADMFGLN